MGYPTLYAKSKTGAIKQWSVSVKGSTITVVHGQVGGAMQEQVTEVKKGKNIGKSNETTPEIQARLEAGSKWNKQIDKDYRENVDDIPESTLPPLAKKYQDAKDQLGDEYDALCKLDGVRCTLFHNNGDIRFQKRGGGDYPVIERIAEEMWEKVWSHSPRTVVDTELYCHGMYLEDIVSAVKKHNFDTEQISAYVFDIFDPTAPEMVWTERHAAYKSMLAESGPHVFSVKSRRITEESEMLAFHDIVVGMDYEGLVLRKLDAKFVFGHRTGDFQKYKVPKDKEFKVIRFDVDKNGCAVPWCYIDNQIDSSRTEFKAPLIGTREYQQEIAQNQEDYIGKHLKVVFEAYSKYGVPAKPKGHVFRELDSDGNPEE